MSPPHSNTRLTRRFRPSPWPSPRRPGEGLKRRSQPPYPRLRGEGASIPACGEKVPAGG
ncbi:hypothetical protein SJ05684_c30960 [Sinorhizobium sojae CCBAU 05684]|uniref:Uncharacterized protein n=1 Tax=Sinorhizobium sojae CCBAU 05684 TaxID=716928 RepID=A0A249PEY9_9HYPH|nr:hypothetical protein SJ05684_c30960 [Sinorhizobium sojae CCBAU 05684]